MKVESIHTYAAAPDVVFAVMTTPDVLIEKYTSLGHADIEILEADADTDTHPGAVAVSTRRSVPMDVPGFAKRFLSPMNTVEQHDRWTAPHADGTRHGTWQVTARGVPVKVGGTLHLAPTAGGGTIVEIRGEVSCSIPIVGGKIASFVGGDVVRTMQAEEAFNDQHLQSQHGVRPRKRAAG